MNSKLLISELFTFCLLVIILATLIFQPMHLLMPVQLTMFIILLLIISFFSFASLYFHERVHDEREDLHRQQSGRNAFLAGSTLLILAITYQSLDHHIDPWLVLTLIIMIATKLVTRINHRLRH